MSEKSEGEGACAWILADPGQPEFRVWGVTLTERLHRTLQAIGFSAERIGRGSLSEGRVQPSVRLIFRSDYVFDERLVRALATSEATALIAPDKKEVVAVHVATQRVAETLQLFSGERSLERAAQQAGVRLVGPSVLVPAYTAALRKADPPYLFAVQPEKIEAIENYLFQASYKGITDLVTKWVWPLPARAVTRCLARAGIRPNVVTVVSWVLVSVAAWLFIEDWFGLGLLAAWVMTFLDTVDGKLARVTLTSSRVGHVLDHGLDLLHPPFWYLAWAMGLPAQTAWLGPATLITVGGYVIGRLLEGIFLLIFKMEIHSWRPIDSAFRTITARRNPNLLLLTAGTLAGRPDIGLILVAFWTACSIGFHTVRLLQALAQRWRGLPVKTWQESGTFA
jgi:phosphatidylglycerophosphate synthase